MNIEDLVKQPRESLAVELKSWINPDSPDGISTLVKATIAMRNNDGGFILIGFDNDSCQPIHDNVPEKIQELFHQDKIQGMVSKNASESFEVEVHFVDIEGDTYPIIKVGPGVRSPIGTKRDFVHGGKNYIPQNKIYVRSLNSNNTPSTTEATWKDWPKVMEVCFDNREADIGRFLRRHLGGINSDTIQELFSTLSMKSEPEPTIEESINNYIQESEKRFAIVVSERQYRLPSHGSWEVALLIVGDVPSHTANRTFLNLLDSNNPNYTGWPIWVDSRGFREDEARPYVVDGVWEVFIPSTETFASDLDFMRLDPKGRFFLRRALQDDMLTRHNAPDPLTVLDFGLPIVRTAEAIAVGIAFAKGMGCDVKKTELAFGFKWSKLKGRMLVSWAKPARYISSGRTAYQDEIFVPLIVPLDTPLSAVGDYVNKVVQPLYELFDGFSLGKKIVEDLSRELIERKL